MQKLEKRLQIMQNKSICFYLQLDKMFAILPIEFKDLNWFAVNTRFEQCIISIKYQSLFQCVILNLLQFSALLK